MAETTAEELLTLNQRLLDAITAGDWSVYQELCDPSLTAFEPEGKGQLVEGLDFHHYYFDLGGSRGPHNVTLCGPKVKLIGDVAIVTYVRLTQHRGPEGLPRTDSHEETRVWHQREGQWRL